MKAFKAYDIRGIYGTEVTEDLAYRVGRCLPKLLETHSFLVGRDTRLSSKVLRDALIRGLTEAGANVDDMGHATTPMTYYFTAAKGYGGAVMITASHNPKAYNGLKVSKAGAKPCGYDLGLRTIEQWIESDTLPPKAEIPGAVREVAYDEEYIAYMQAHLPIRAAGHFAVDCSDGVAGLFARRIFGDRAIYLNDIPDGTFPHHGPNPLDADSRKQLVDCVISNGLDFGLIFDGDADRVALVDNIGRFVPPDAMIPLYAHLLGKGDSSGVVVHDVRTSRGVIETLREDGFDARMVRVGAAYAKTVLREENGLCGGEVAGHYYFRDFFYCDSGILAACLTLRIAANLREKGKTLAAALAPIIDRYHSSGEVNIHGVEDRSAAIGRVVEALLKVFGEPEKRIDFDGTRLDWKDSWFGVRASNTEPILRLAGEARTPEALTKLLDTARGAV